MLAFDMAKAIPGVFEKAKGQPRREAIENPLSDLLEEPNDWQTWPEFCIQMQIGLSLRGNAYAIIIRNDFRPLFFVPVNPDYCALWEAPDGSLFYRVTPVGLHQMAMLRREPFLIPARDVLHLKQLSSNGLVGMSPIAMNREAIALALAQEQQSARWMGNAAKPGGILTTDQKLTQDVADRCKAQWVAAQSGLINSGKTAVLEMGLKWQQLTMSSADLEFIASRRFQIEEIARMFRIPISMVAEVASTSKVDPDKLAQHYVNYTLSDFTTLWAAGLAKKFDLRRSGLRVRFDMSAILEADLASRINMNRLAVLGSLRTPNEGREGIGDDPSDDPEANKLIFPANTTPYGSDHSGNAPDGAGRPSKNGTGDPDQPGAD